jgi:CHAT domain-containing protein/Tfp pilus assembly protein PilF
MKWHAVFIALVAISSSASPSLGQTGTPPALLVELLPQREAAYRTKDIDAALRLWSDRSPHRDGHRQQLGRLLKDPSLLRVTEVADGEARVDGDTAQLRIRQSSVMAAAPPAAPVTRDRLILLEYVREHGVWKIWKETPAAEDLAGRLATAPDRAAQLRILDENVELVGSDLASALNDRGRQARNAGDRPLAQRVYELALEVGDRAGLPAVRALALNNIGLVNYETGNFDTALDWYRRSLALSEQNKDERGIVRSLNNIAIVYSDIGELSVAAEHFERCIGIGERLKDALVIGNGLNNMALVYGRRGDYVNALANLQRSYDLTSPTDKRGLAGSLLNLGNVYLWQGDYALAEDRFRRAMAFAEEAKVRFLTAIAVMSLGRVAEFRGNFPAALGEYTKSLAISEEIDDKPNAANALSFIASTHLKTGDIAAALTYFQRSIDQYRAIGAGAELPLALTGLAAAYNRANRPDAALSAAREAAELARRFDAREAVWRAHLEAGKASLALGDGRQSELEWAAAIETIESLRLDVVGGEFERQGFFADKLEPYHRLMALLVDNGRTSDGLEYAERAKARILVEALSAGRTRVESAMNGEQRARNEKFRLQLASLNMRLAREEQRQAATAALAAEIDRVRLEYAVFQSTLFASHPELKVQRGEIDPVPVSQLGKLVPPGGAVLEFVVTEDTLYSFVITRNARDPSAAIVEVVRTAAPRGDLRRRVQDFQSLIAGRDLNFRRNANDLHRLLIAPIRGALGRARTLTIVPDGVLWELSFQAVLSPAGRFLLDDFVLSYAPSLTALTLMQERRARLVANRPAPRLLAMGNPAWDAQVKSRTVATYRDANLGSLELAEVEVARIAALYGPSRSQVYVRDQATERRFKAEAGDRQILHVATHGILNDASPLYSHVLLTPSGGAALEDGLLEAWELLQMKLRAELVVFSACETARGRITAGEGTIGLSWALFVAGVPTTVLSQWKADSAATTDLMVAFHTNLRRGMDEAGALRAAALTVRKNPAHAHPVYWAAFITVGAGQSVVGR